MVQLPVVSQNDPATADALIRAAKRAELILARTLAQETALDGCTALTNSNRPHVRLANFVTEVSLTSSDNPREFFERVTLHFQNSGTTCRSWRSAHPEWNKSLSDLLVSTGFIATPHTVYRLVAAPGIQSPRCDFQIIPARSAYGQLRALYAGRATQIYPGKEEAGREWVNAQIDLLDEPRFDLLMARRDGVPVGVSGVVTLGQIGVLHGLYVPVQADGEAVARTLLIHTLEHCAWSQFEQVIVDLAGHDPWVGVYESVGFAPLATFTNYDRP